MRTEAKTMQVHPRDEQYYIDVMQEFHWNLKSSQEIKTRDSHVETRGGQLYNVTESSNYVKLVFERPIEFPNKDEVVKLENEYFGMSYQSEGTLKYAILISIAVALIGIFERSIIAFLFLGGGVFWIYSINQTNIKKQQQWKENNTKREAILVQAKKLITF